MTCLSTWDLDVMKEAPTDYCDSTRLTSQHIIVIYSRILFRSLSHSLSISAFLVGAQPQPFPALCKHFRAKLIRRVAFSTGEECVSE